MDEMDLTMAESKATYEEIRDYVLEHGGLADMWVNLIEKYMSDLNIESEIGKSDEMYIDE